MTLSKNIHNNIGGALFLGVITFVFTSFIVNQHTEVSSDQDPLNVLLGLQQEDATSGLKADFPSEGPNRALLQSYTGPKSAEMLQCIAESQPFTPNGIVYAAVDKEELVKMLEERADGTFNRSDIRNELLPVLGHAMVKMKYIGNGFPKAIHMNFICFQQTNHFGIVIFS